MLSFGNWLRRFDGLPRFGLVWGKRLQLRLSGGGLLPCNWQPRFRRLPHFGRQLRFGGTMPILKPTHGIGIGQFYVHRIRHALNILHRHGLKPEAVGINIQVLVRDEEKIILLCRPQTSKTREYDRFPLYKDLLQLRKKLCDIHT